MTYRVNFYETADEDVLRWKKNGAGESMMSTE